MNTKQLLLGFIVLGIILSVLDGLFFGGLLNSTFAGIAGVRPMAEVNPVWFILGDFAVAAVFVWLYSIARGSFKSGSHYGMVVGIVIAFPGMLYWSLQVKGFPYWLSWVMIVWTILEATVAGIILDKIAKPKAK